ncbi:MAG: DUF1311 domain-containing protein [Bdellovibrionaceae bacterium]|nr:DUF1311 domain-containing protein [Pseudobdellovibrionaceae bacterium]
MNIRPLVLYSLFLALMPLSSKSAPRSLCVFSDKLTLTERLICKSNDLSALDTELDIVYSKVLSRLKPKEKADLIVAQKKWQHERDKCLQASCIHTKILERIVVLDHMAQVRLTIY